jgi:hypothetical protein
MTAVWRYIVASWRGELSIIAAFLVYGGGGLIVLTALGIFLAFRGDFDGSHPTIYSTFKLIYLIWFNLAGIVVARSAYRLAKTGKSRARRYLGAAIAAAIVVGLLFPFAQAFVQRLSSGS